MPSPPIPSLPTDSVEAGGEAAIPNVLSLRKVLWPVLLSLLVLGVISYLTFDLKGFREIVSELNPWMLGLAALTVFVRVASGAWRLSYISRGRLSLSAATRTQLAWDFFSNVTPSAIGGGPFAAVYMARDRNISLGDATAVLLFTMLLDQIWFAFTIPVVIAASFFVDVIPPEIGTVGSWAVMLYFVGMLVWVVSFGYLTVFRPDLLQRLLDTVFGIRWLRRFRGRLDREMVELQRRAKVLRSQPARFYANGLLLTVVTWASRYLLLLFIVWSVFDEFDTFLLLLRTTAMALGTVILPTPGGSGGIEGLYALFIGPMIPTAALAPTLLTFRILGYYIFIALGVFLSTHHMQKSIRSRRRAEWAALHGPAAGTDSEVAGVSSHHHPAE